MTDIDELDRLAKAATPGPWSVCRHLESVEADEACTCGYRGVVYGPEHDVPMAICQPGHDAEPEGEEGLGPQNYERAIQIANGQHIAAANPAAILALTAEVRSLSADADLWRTEMRLRNDQTVAIMFAGVDNRCVIYRSGIAISAAGTYADAIAAAHPKEHA